MSKGYIIADNSQDYNTVLKVATIYNKEFIDFLLEYNIPMPIAKGLSKDGNMYRFEYLITGYFNTKTSIEYFNDIIARFVLSFIYGDNLYFTNYRTRRQEQKPIDLSMFQNLKSIEPVKKEYKLNPSMKNDIDIVFWALKSHFEYLIKQKKYSYEMLEIYAFDNFVDNVKDQSTLRAKCRSIFNYYYERDFRIPQRKKYERQTKTKETWDMTRSEHMKKVKTNQKKETRKKILSTITGMFANEYKLPNGNWNKSKLARDLGISLATIKRHFKEIEAENATPK